MQVLQANDLLIKASTGEYPVTVRQFRQRGGDAGWAFGETIPVELANSCGFYVVERTPAPEGEVVTEIAPTGNPATGYVQAWEVRDYNTEELEAAISSAKSMAMDYVASQVDAVIYVGRKYQFDSGEQHVQLDLNARANITALAQMAERNPDRTFYFRTYENQINVMTADEIGGLADFAFDAYTGLLETKWQLEDSVMSAKTLAEIPSNEDIEAALAE